MRFWTGTVCLIAFNAALLAETPVAKASSNEPFVLRDAEVPVNGVPNWPVYPGDHIVAGNALTILKFGCRVHIPLNPGIGANVSPDGKKLTVHLPQGDKLYNLSRGCPVAAALLGTAAAGGGTALGLVKSNTSSDPPSVSAR